MLLHLIGVLFKTRFLSSNQLKNLKSNSPVGLGSARSHPFSQAIEESAKVQIEGQ